MDRVEYQPLIIQDIINLERTGDLNLNPWYQRRSVWTPAQKAYLINTIFEQKPVPSLYIRHSLDLEKEKSIKEVVDGQQRIRCVLEYSNAEFSARHPRHEKKVRYAELSKAEKQSFRMTALSVGFLVGATDSDVIEIFGRLNSVAKTLNPQEKRNARFSGEFKQFCLKEASQRITWWRGYRIFTANDIARMAEVQFVSELAINMREGLQDYSVRAIDNYYQKFDENFPEEKRLSDRMELTFAKLAEVNIEAIRDTIFSRSPLFFSLFLIVDSLKGKVDATKIEQGLYEIDESFNSDVPLSERSKADAEFYVACTATTQRIKSRRIRDKYIRRVLK
jgi:Protein of unknown function DUF262